MSTVRSHTGTTAFRSRSSDYLAGMPLPAAHERRSTAAPEPAAAPVARPTVRPRPRVQDLWLMLIVLAAMCGCIVGLLYLSSYADLAREGYRRVELLAELRAEREKSKQYQEIKARVYSPEYIEKQAGDLKMIHADEAQTVTIGNR